MKDKLNQLRSLSEGIENTEVKMQIDSLVSAIDSDYNSLQTKLSLTTKESIGRKQKLADAYQKLNDMDELKLKLNQFQNENINLAKYREKAVEQKSIYNERIKTLFDTKLANQNNKDYSKYQKLISQFDFENATEQAYDSNRRNYELLELGGVFGNQKLIAPTLKKPASTTTKQTSGRWNK